MSLRKDTKFGYIERLRRPALWLMAALFKVKEARARHVPAGEAMAGLFTRLEARLKESEEKHRNLFENMSEGVCFHEIIYDDSGKATDYVVTDVNLAYELITGLSKGEVVGRKASELYGTGEPPYLETYAIVSSTRKPVSFETYFPPMKKHFSISVFSPGPGEFATVFSDITERKQAEEALRESQRDMNRAQAVADIGSWRLDIKRNELLWSDETYRIFDIPKGTPMTYESFLSALHPEDREYVDRKWTAALRSERYDIEHRILAGNEVKWVREKAELEFDQQGALMGGFGTVQDITERKQAEEELRETRDYLENLINYANAPIIVWDPQFRITRFNHAFERLTGRSANEVLGKELDVLFPEDSREESLAHIRRAVAGERWEVVEIPILRNDGTIRTVLWNSATLYAADVKTVVATIAQGQDITERKQAEEELQHRTDELARSNAELEQFAYIASHDLQEPLRMVSSYVQLLANRYKAKLDKDADDFINYAQDGATRMQRLINDLLAYSHVGTRRRSFEDVSLETVFTQALNNLKLAIKDTGAVITHDLLPIVYGDGGQLTQVFQNLVDNAIKFRGDEPPQIHVSAVFAGGEWVCSVHDNGIGIAPEYADRIFLLFQRLHHRREYPGTGIGLAICKRIVEQHGGRIWVESKHGEGSAFYFTIPGVTPKE